ncbi:MAG: putative F420-0--gamma-glutamyl ligase [Parcubacteria group bacterium]|nr:putative F420-0--gamma-glutamyl ligase [Parcubacteria group bacterium]
MQVTAYKLRKLLPPKDNLLEAIKASRMQLKEGDIVAISSKVVSIDEGICLPMEGIDKEKLKRQEAERYIEFPRAKYKKLYTISAGALAGASGIDESNGNGHYILYPKDPMQSARRLRNWLKREYGIKQLGVVITDSISLPLRRGAVGFALSWDGFEPLQSYKDTPDIFGRPFQMEVANIADALAVAAVLEMGEGNQQTPIAVIRNATQVTFTERKQKPEPLVVALNDDLFAPFLHTGKKWKRGKRA